MICLPLSPFHRVLEQILADENIPCKRGQYTYYIGLPDVNPERGKFGKDRQDSMFDNNASNIVVRHRYYDASIGRAQTAFIFIANNHANW